jgi:cell division protein FtsI (penicillin-binding protein 3)
MVERPRLRLHFLTFVLGLLGLIIMVRLVSIQIFSYEELEQKGYEWRLRHIPLEPMRGRILDANGHVLADNYVQYDVGASPGLISDLEKTAEMLATELQMDEGELYRELSQELPEDKLWILLESGVSRQVGEEIAAAELRGITVEPVWRRSYPEGTLGAHVLGFVNAENQGYYGIESFYDESLKGVKGERTYQQDGYGFKAVIPLGLASDDPAQPGVDLILTIDRTIQALVEEELNTALRETGSESGIIIVMQPRTGEILAMAAAPIYDPNEYWGVKDTRLFVNPAINSQYEPGSVFKVLTVAVALENGSVTPETLFYDEGQIEVGGQVIYNATRESYGYVTLTEVLIHSLNVETARISTLMGPDRFYQGIHRFGIGQRTRVDLAGEVVGELRVPGDYRWHESDLATNAFGQGLAVTPLQMITAVAAIANDGLLMQPYLVEQKIYADGRVERAQPVPVEYAVSAQTAHTVAEMMAQTVENGIQPAQVPGYRIAGKTGTAQLWTPLGYDEQNTIASFVGFAPVEDPQVIVLVRLDKPTSSQWGTQTAAPTFARLAKQLFVVMGIPPDTLRLEIAELQ